MASSIPLRVLRSTSAAPIKKEPAQAMSSGGCNATPMVLDDMIPASPSNSPAPLVRSDSQGNESSHSSSETTFSLDREQVEGLFKAVLPQLHEPLLSKLSGVSLDVYASKLLQVVLSLALIAKILMEAFGAMK